MFLFGGAPAAFADVDSAAKDFAESAYPLMKNINWARNPVFTKWLESASQEWNPEKVSIAVDKLIEAGLSMDKKLIGKAVQAHQAAVEDAISNDPKGLLASKGAVVKVVQAISEMLVSADKARIGEVYNSVMGMGIQ